MTRPEPEPVIGSLPAFTWDSEEVAAYEAAIEAVNDLVGAYTARITAERAAIQPDTSAITALEDQLTEAVRMRASLDPTKHDQIAKARKALAQKARALMAGRE